MIKTIVLCISLFFISSQCVAENSLPAVMYLLLAGEQVNVTTCNDQKDNDGDGWVDRMDPDCVRGDNETGSNRMFECNDLIDNDRDGKIDSFDSGCLDGSDNSEFK